MLLFQYIFFLISSNWVPVYADNEKRLSIISIAFFLDSKTDAVIWRGPKKNGEVINFIVYK